MTATATSPRPQRPNEKPAPTGERVMVRSRAWFGCSYFGAATNDWIATAASCEMGCTPDSRLAMVRRLTPRRAASPACVRPSRSRCSRYCAEVMLSAGESQLRTSAGALNGSDNFSAGLASRSAGRVVAVVNIAAHWRELLEAPCSVFVLLGLGHGAVCEWLGVHGLGSFGVGVAQWQREDNAESAHETQEKRCRICIFFFSLPNVPAQATTPAPTKDDHGTKQ